MCDNQTDPYLTAMAIAAIGLAPQICFQIQFRRDKTRSIKPCMCDAMQQDAKPGKIMIQRFYRPEDISKDLAYKSEFWDVYASPEPPSSGRCEWVQWVDVDMVVRKCAARAVGGKVPEGEAQEIWAEYCIYDIQHI
eukprot:GHUV01030833.1.p2 GENE.GHUV01030833.1~~GHUV01030833.1.p2  ORF type:complete len:136 (+),score=30.76 GHUV01030833.1:516-923(+)